MVFRRILLFLLCCICLTGMAHAASIAGELSDRLDTDHYDYILELLPSKALNTTEAVRIALESDVNKNSIFVTLTRGAITIQGVKKSQIARIENPGVVPGKPYRLTIMRREKTLGLLHDNTLLFRGEVPRGPGKLAGVTMDGGTTSGATSGWANNSEPRIQRLEPVHFEDDFMRTKDEDSGAWSRQSGRWDIKSAWDAIPQGNAGKFSNIIFAQNPFAWVGRYENGKTVPAVCTAGDPFWEDYTFSAAVQPCEDGAVGIVVNMPDGHNGLLVRWTPVSDRGRSGKLTLSRVEKDKILEPLATSPGGYIPGQWYKLSVISSLDGIRVFVDGVERIVKNDITPWRGGIGLYAEGVDGTIFDDIKVFGRTFDADLLFETQQTDVNQRFESDISMGNWANPKSEWIPAGNPVGFYWYRHEVFGDHVWMNLTVKPLAVQTGELWMTLNGDGQTPTKGLRAVVQVSTNPTQVTYALYHDQKQLARKQSGQPLTSDSEYSFRFWRVGDDIWLEVDGETVVKAHIPNPVTGLCPAFKADGCFVQAHDEVVLSHHMLDYTFSSAPTDWLTEGTWMPTNRWSCEPKWSFLAGWSRGDAVMWHKQRFTGDQTFEAFVAPKMEYPGERDTYDYRYRDFNITICGDGKNPRSGYTGIYSYDSGDGIKKIALLRNGRVVASQPLEQRFVPTRNSNHRSWFNLELRKRGGMVEFLVTFAWLPKEDPVTKLKTSEVLRLNYPDENPIEGGVPAVWTTNNGINISRARVRFVNPPVPRTEPMVSVSDVWYPEWANVDQPLTLDYSSSWSTTGKPVHLTMTPRAVPKGDEAAVKVDGTRLTFTPQQADVAWNSYHWYEIKATDGENLSPSVHLELHVFDPKQHKRDDSGALVLYRFDEGKGDVARDQSGKAPAADLQIVKKNASHWLPGQGLAMSADSFVMTKQGVDKLLAIQKTSACTIEFWLSTDSVYPINKPDLGGWVSCIFSWDCTGPTKDSQRNMSVLQVSPSTILVCPRDVPIASNGNTAFPGAIRTGMEHIVITWDGTGKVPEMTLYLNGVSQGKKLSPIWNEDKMTPGSPLILGNNVDGKAGFLGSFYLFAIHNRCLTPDDVRRHYLAGPSGR